MMSTEVHVVVGKRRSGKSSRLLTLARDHGVGRTLVVVSHSAALAWFRERCPSADVVVIAHDDDGDEVSDDPAILRLISTGGYACVILDDVVYTDRSLLTAATIAQSVRVVLVSMTHPTMVPIREVLGR